MTQVEILATELGTAEHNKLAGGHERVAVRAMAPCSSRQATSSCSTRPETIQERSHKLLTREALSIVTSSNSTDVTIIGGSHRRTVPGRVSATRCCGSVAG